MKVLFMLHDSRRSGVPAVISNLVRSLDRSKITPVVLFAYDGAYAGELRDAGVEVHNMGRRFPFLWRSYRFLFNLYLVLLARRVDVTHINSVKLAWSVIIARLLGMRVIYHLHEMPAVIGVLLKTAIRLADTVVFCSNTCAGHFEHVPAQRKCVLVNGVMPDSFPPVGGCSGVQRIVMVGSINNGKGQDLLLRAFARLPRRDVELYFYGTTGLSAHGYVHELKCFVRAQGLTDRVFFPGPAADIRDVLAHCSLLVHTSLQESFGMALVEAMASGVPVIAHDLGGMREVVADGITGFLVPPGDSEALAERITQVLGDQSLRQRFGQAGRVLVREKFDMASRVDDYYALCREACRQ